MRRCGSAFEQDIVKDVHRGGIAAGRKLRTVVGMSPSKVHLAERQALALTLDRNLARIGQDQQPRLRMWFPLDGGQTAHRSASCCSVLHLEERPVASFAEAMAIPHCENGFSTPDWWAYVLPDLPSYIALSVMNRMDRLEEDLRECVPATTVIQPSELAHFVYEYSQATNEAARVLMNDLAMLSGSYVEPVTDLVEAFLSGSADVITQVLSDPRAIRNLRSYAREEHGVQLDDSSVVVALDHAVFDDLDGCMPLTPQRLADRDTAMVAQLMFAPATMNERGIHAIPRWVYTLVHQVLPHSILSQPIDVTDDVLEAAVALWSDNPDEPFNDFDTCLRAAERL